MFDIHIHFINLTQNKSVLYYSEGGLTIDPMFKNLDGENNKLTADKLLS